jgi:ABC-type multidrug transport system fused ATPase/permease subunit
VSSLPAQIGLVSQEYVLFSATISKNIAVGCDATKVTQTDIEEAAKLANAHAHAHILLFFRWI